MSKKNVLIISFAYPPLNYPGSIRVSKITKNLIELGFNPIVITAKSGFLETKSNLEIPIENIHYVDWFDPYVFINKMLNNKNFFFKIIGKVLKYLIPFGTTRLPELRRQFWRKPAIKKSLLLINKYKIDFIYSSSSPPSSAIIASAIARKKKIIWFAEFRDPWTQNPYNPKNILHTYFERKYEKYILKNANRIITISKTMASDFEKIHRKKTLVVYNGFDESDYKLKNKKSKKFTIVHTGSIYGDKRDPSKLFEAIKSLKDENYIFYNKINIQFYGSNLKKVLNPLIKKYRIEDRVSIFSKIDKDKINVIQKNSNILLLLAWNNVLAKATLTAKIFEYVGAKRPILAQGYEFGEIANFLKKYDCGKLINKPAQITIFIKKCINDWHNKNNNFGFKFNGVSKFKRISQTKKIIDEYNYIKYGKYKN